MRGNSGIRKASVRELLLCTNTTLSTRSHTPACSTSTRSFPRLKRFRYRMCGETLMKSRGKGGGIHASEWTREGEAVNEGRARSCLCVEERQM
jgi:hypothetical protein